MSAARTAILSRLAAAQRTARLPRPGEIAPLAQPARTLADCLARFREELQALGVACAVEATAEAVRRRLRALVDCRRVLSWDPAQLPYDGGSVLDSPILGSAAREEQAVAEVGVTGCDGAIAETGTLVLYSGRGRARTVSLLPSVHIALVRPQDLCFSMGEFFAENAERIGAEACCTFITGPSRTADIELTLTLGVHGPGQVVVLVGP
jgi:L-lactate dehydrogenase complex protein LldG